MQCVFEGTSFLSRLIGTVLGVLGLFLVLFVPSLYARVWKRDVAVQTFQTFKIRASAILLILYAPISRVIISSFRCDDLGIHWMKINSTVMALRSLLCDQGLTESSWTSTTALVVSMD